MSHAKPLNQDHIVPTQIERKPTRYCGANKTNKRDVALEVSWNHTKLFTVLIYVHLLQTPPTPWGCCHSITTIKDASPPDLFFGQIWAQCQRLKAILWRSLISNESFPQRRFWCAGAYQICNQCKANLLSNYYSWNSADLSLTLWHDRCWKSSTL